jgi:hypothetical protein
MVPEVVGVSNPSTIESMDVGLYVGKWKTMKIS